MSLDQIRADSEGLTDLCPEYLRQGIRHLNRNCDIECNEHGDSEDWDACKQPDRYDGDRMARALASIPRLLNALDAVLAQADALDEMAGLVVGEDLIAGLHMAARGIRNTITDALGDTV